MDKIYADLNMVDKAYELIYMKNLQKVNPDKEIVIIPRKENV